jgi:hypothetical protein
MTVREKLGRAQAVLVLGSDDGNRSIYPDPAWLMAGETGTEAFEQVSKHRKSYTAGIILTATELRELADTVDHDTPETVKSALLRVYGLSATESGSSTRGTSLMYWQVLSLFKAGGMRCSLEVAL